MTFEFSISGVEQKRGRCLAGTGQTKLIRSQIALIDTTSLPITVTGTEGGDAFDALYISKSLNVGNYDVNIARGTTDPGC